MQMLKKLFLGAANKLSGRRLEIRAKVAEDARKIGSTGIQVALAAWVIVNDQVTALEAFSLLVLSATLYAVGVLAGSKEED